MHGPAQTAAHEQVTEQRPAGVQDDVVDVEGASGHQGALRELHWHPTTNEWQYYIEGQSRMGVFAASG